MGNIRKEGILVLWGQPRVEWFFFKVFHCFYGVPKTTNILLAKQFKGQWYRSLNNFC